MLDSVSSPIAKRVYNMALDEFLGWFQQAPRPGFTKATVSTCRAPLEARGLGSSSIIWPSSAVCYRNHRKENARRRNGRDLKDLTRSIAEFG